MNYYHLIIHSLLTLLAVATLQSCSMMETDLSGCPTGLYVSFKYDYNVQRADMFNDHVGSVDVYVFDESNRFVMKKSAENTPQGAPLQEHGFNLHFDEQELPAGNYRLLAWAQQHGYDASLATPGAKFRRNGLKPGDPIDQLFLTLDREAVADDGTARVPHNNLPLDTLWATRNPELHHVRLLSGCPTRDTLSLVRNTKQLNITLRQTEEPETLSHEDFDVRITDRNGRLLYDNSTDPNDDLMLYTPYAQWTTEWNTESSAAAQRAQATLGHTAHYEFFLNRLVWHDSSNDNARLVITNRQTGQVAADIDLTRILSDGRNCFELQNYSAQEFLDREYQYSLDFILTDGEWKEMTLRISIMDWARRYQQIDLGPH
ncbi:MAG: FimB/Mfa2 family fimbrial subunit [Bacteroidales bacterium]|nr:FimB/Mfa2 family fimbrial subunit [Bacteroidales bacterium]